MGYCSPLSLNVLASTDYTIIQLRYSYYFYLQIFINVRDWNIELSRLWNLILLIRRREIIARSRQNLFLATYLPWLNHLSLQYYWYRFRRNYKVHECAVVEFTVALWFLDFSEVPHILLMCSFLKVLSRFI